MFWIVVGLIPVTILLLYQPDASNYRQKRETEPQTCIARGRTYYTGIGSYPTLSDGRNAEQVIREFCSHNRNLFD
jgi:hypothetical protein